MILTFIFYLPHSKQTVNAFNNTNIKNDTLIGPMINTKTENLLMMHGNKSFRVSLTLSYIFNALDRHLFYILIIYLKKNNR